MRDAVWSAQREWADDGYILVDQDIRGKYGSEGDYVMTRPPIGPLNPTKTDDTTDAYDTIDWLVKNVPESNGRVGMIGSSYDGWTVTMALLGPHPALKVAAPESPMIDGWMGDDWFHYGAFRQVNLDYFTEQSSVRGEGMIVPRPGDDDYQNFLDAGTAGNWAELNGLKQLPWWNRLSAHPAYDAFWQLQALDKLVVAEAGEHSHAVAAGPVGPGGHVWRRAHLGGAEGRRARGQQSPGDGAVVSQPGESRGREPGTAEVEGRHGGGFSARRADSRSSIPISRIANRRRRCRR